jgi:formiminoglutamase
MEHVIFYDKRHIAPLIHLRQGERKVGERVRLLEPGEGLKDLSDCARKGVRFALVGIPESVGPMGNYGKCCTDYAWPAFLEAFLNMQSNQFYQGGDILCLGELNTKEINEAASLLMPDDEEYIAKLRTLCSLLDEMVYPVIEELVRAGISPVVIGGGHNNTYGILKGASRAFNALQGIQCINCDPHADLRPLEGRHSGNGFSYARAEGYLKRYFIFGLHENYNSQQVMEQMAADPDMGYSSFDSLLPLEHHLHKAYEFFEDSRLPPGLPLGIEVDMDSITDMPSSAMTPSGFSVEEVRRFVRSINSRFGAAYLHLAEGAPVIDTNDMIKVGKTLAYLVLDFVKTAKRHNSLEPEARKRTSS